MPTVPPPFSVITDKRLDELSGIAVSRSQPGVFYVHNDSGDSSRFFAIGGDGSLKEIFYYKGEPSLSLGVRDVEDITIGPGPDSSADYIYLGDIGDNFARREYITVYRVKEPRLRAGVAASAAGAATPAEAAVPHAHIVPAGVAQPPEAATAFVDAAPLYLRYPDGARDAETLLADPVDRRLYIVSKREDSVTVYSTPLDFRTGDTVMLTRHTKLLFPGAGTDKWITAGDVSPKGDQLLVKSLTGVFYWQRSYRTLADSSKQAEPLWQTMRRQPILEPYQPEKQGEAIGFSPDAKSFYTVSEGRHPKLYHYPVVMP